MQKRLIWLILPYSYSIILGTPSSYFEKSDVKVKFPTTWDINFDCKIKKLAFDYTKKLSPGSGQSDLDFQLVFDALQLGAVCNETYPANVEILKPQSYFSEEEEKENYYGHEEIFVDHKFGKNSFKGTISQPLSNIQDGIDTCYLRLEKNKNIHRCFVYVRKGTYHITKPIILTSNVHLKTFKNEHVIISGHKAVRPTWKQVLSTVDKYENYSPIFESINPKQSTKSIHYFGITSDITKCQALCVQNCTSFVFYDKTVKGFENQCYGRLDGLWNAVTSIGAFSGKKITIYSANLSKEQLSVVDQVFYKGKRYTRARFPNADPVSQGLHTKPTGYVSKAESWLPPKKYEDATEIHVATPTRNATLFPAFEIGIGGPVSQFNPPQSYWGTKYPFGGGGSTYRVPTGLKYSDDLEINLRSWKNPSTGFVHTFQNLHWENWVFSIDDRDEKENTLKWTRGGFQGGRGSNSGGEWYVENIFEELDVANEWFYDESTKLLFFMPNLTNEILPEEIMIPQIPSLIKLIGSQNQPLKHVHITGFTFEGTTTTFMEPYMVPSGGDWTVHPNGMIYLEGTEDVLISHCIFDSPGGNGLFALNYNRNTVISHNTMLKLGDNGIVLVGEARLIDGSVGNQPRGVQILYNTVTENGIWGKQTYSFVQSVSCETTLEGNVFFSGPRAGINFNDGFGGGNLVQSNLLFNFVRETDDHGPINTWDRVPYLTRVSDGKTLSLNVKENAIHNNFIINNYRSVWPLDHDDGTCYWRDTYNYLVYGGFKNYLGHDKISDHNIYVYPDRHPDKEAFKELICAGTAGQTLGTSGYNDEYTNNICVIGTGDNIYGLGSCDPDPAKLPQLIPHFANNQIFTPNATFKIRCRDQVWDLKEAQTHGVDVGTKVGTLPADDEVIQWGKDLLGL